MDVIVVTELARALGVLAACGVVALLAASLCGHTPRRPPLGDFDNNEIVDCGVIRSEHQVAPSVVRLRAAFERGLTRTHAARLAQLRRLRALLTENRDAIVAAVRADLGKPDFEILATEYYLLLHEIDEACANLHAWMTPRSVPSPVGVLPARSAIAYEPLGVVLIIAPWNYPVNLALAPLIGSIAAGTICVYKVIALFVRVSVCV